MFICGVLVIPLGKSSVVLIEGFTGYIKAEILYIDLWLIKEVTLLKYHINY